MNEIKSAIDVARSASPDAASEGRQTGGMPQGAGGTAQVGPHGLWIGGRFIEGNPITWASLAVT
jgi:hypothetical protein